MKKEVNDLVGQRFGRLVVLEYAGKINYGKAQVLKVDTWKCLCDCGNTKTVIEGNLLSGNTKSCGCMHKEMVENLNRTHGLSGKCGRLYPLWKSIKYRCYNPNSKSYKDYGGRGIKMCDEWRNDFKSFYDWAIENGYKEEKTDKGINILTIDRINVDGNYEPSNCRFITNAEQAKNRRNSMSDKEKECICPVCGKKFIQLQRNGNKTCSIRCGVIRRNLEHPNLKDYTKVCPICGKTFDAKRDGHFDRAIYCSVDCKNKSKSPIWEFDGESHRACEWSEIIGISTHCLLNRFNLGWSIEEILTTPKGVKRNA